MEPVLSGTVFSGHPLLSGHVAKSQKFNNINTIKETFIERSPLLSGRGHLSYGPNLISHCFETVLNGHWKTLIIRTSVINECFDRHFTTVFL